jgi:hypothetical protein
MRPAGVLGIALEYPISQPDSKKRPGGNCLAETEIRRLVKRVRPSELVLIANKEEHPLLPALADMSPKIEIRTGWAQFLTISGFQKIAICQDAGHWWAAFLGQAREIYFPPLDRGPWSHAAAANFVSEPSWHGIDLRVPGDSRYVYDW